MPNYNYKCNKCDHAFEERLMIADRKIPEQSPCPECGATESVVQQITAPMICDPVRVGARKMDSGFKEVLQKIHERAPGSELNKSSSQM
jgi:putative FmdB family regulatory protein